MNTRSKPSANLQQTKFNSRFVLFTLRNRFSGCYARIVAWHPERRTWSSHKQPRISWNLTQSTNLFVCNCGKIQLAVLDWQTAWKLWKEHCFLLAVGKLLKDFSLKLFLRCFALRINYYSEQYVAKNCPMESSITAWQPCYELIDVSIRRDIQNFPYERWNWTVWVMSSRYNVFGILEV